MSLEYYFGGDGPKEFMSLLSACIASAGKDAFNVPFLEMIEKVIRADQCTVFSYNAPRPCCYLSYNKRKKRSAINLSQKYLRSGYQQDPLCEVIEDVRRTKDVKVVDLEDIRPKMTPEYLRTFFSDIGIADKISVVSSSDSDLIVMNFYRFDEGGIFHRSDPAIRNMFWETIARIVLLHYSSPQFGSITSPLNSLSEREKSICTAMLRGMTADAIAWELDISPDTVKTYRRRAYEKLGINSKSALFELCHRS